MKLFQSRVLRIIFDQRDIKYQEAEECGIMRHFVMLTVHEMLLWRSNENVRGWMYSTHGRVEK